MNELTEGEEGAAQEDDAQMGDADGGDPDGNEGGAPTFLTQEDDDADGQEEGEDADMAEGEDVWSEPESAAVRDFLAVGGPVRQDNDLMGGLDLHSFGQLFNREPARRKSASTSRLALVIARALHCDPAFPLKYCGIELGAITTYSADTDRAIINGKHDDSELQEQVLKFVEAFILCPNCRLPDQCVC